MKLLALSALTVLSLRTTSTADATCVYYITNIGTLVASQSYKNMESNYEPKPTDPQPEPPAKGGTGGSRADSSLKVKMNQCISIGNFKYRLAAIA